MRAVLVPAERVVRWVDNAAATHGAFTAVVERGALVLRAPDGVVARLRPPFDVQYDGPPTAIGLAEAARSAVPDHWAVLLVRKGGFAVAAVSGRDVGAVKVGQRHVQGRSKAGGQSQQRFARRRDNQARQAYEAAAAHAARILTGPVSALVCGGDRQAVDTVLVEPALRRLAAVRTGPWLAVPDPRRAVLDQAVRDALAVQVAIEDGEATGPG